MSDHRWSRVLATQEELATKSTRWSQCWVGVIGLARDCRTHSECREKGGSGDRRHDRLPHGGIPLADRPGGPFDVTAHIWSSYLAISPAHLWSASQQMGRPSPRGDRIDYQPVSDVYKGSARNGSQRAILGRYASESSRTFAPSDRQVSAVKRTRLRGSALRAKAERRRRGNPVSGMGW